MEATSPTTEKAGAATFLETQQSTQEETTTAQRDKATPVSKNNDAIATTNNASVSKKRKRAICSRCERPAERSCLCSALPDTRIVLQECHCLVLQHPRELKRTNRSLPFVHLCMSEASWTCAISRTLTKSVLDDRFFATLHNPDTLLWLVFPCPQAVPFHQALEEWRQQDDATAKPGTPIKPRKKITLLFLDATWQFAKEMDDKNRDRNLYPSHLQRVQLTPQDLQDLKKPRRFEIRTPPSEQHLSTAEALAWMISKIEKNDTIYSTLMRPLDLMVSQQRAFAQQSLERKQTKIAKQEDS